MSFFKPKTTWNRLEEATFKPIKSSAEFGLNITDPTRVKIPKLAEIPGRIGHNIIEATRTQVVAHLENAYVNKMAFCIWGDTGVSKSATVNEFAEEVFAKYWASKGRKLIRINGLSRPKGAELKSGGEGVTLSDKSDVYLHPEKYFFLADVRVSLLEEIDLKGVPNVEAESNIQTSYTPPLIHLVSQPNAAGIIFFDEVNRTNNTGVKSALLSVFDKKDKRLGDALISEDILPVAAANIGFGFGDVAEIDAALKNRGGAAWLNLTCEEWLKYAKRPAKKGTTADITAAPVTPAATPVPQSDYLIHPAVTAFIEQLPHESRFKGKPAPTAENQEAFNNILKYPTYRGYELMSDGLYAAIARYNEGALKNHEEILTEAIAQAGATCGHAFAEEFAKFMRESATALSLGQIEKFIDKPNPSNLQTTVAACKTNVLAYADAFFTDGDKTAEKNLKGWVLVTFKLPPEHINAVIAHIKSTVASSSVKEVKELPGQLAGFMLQTLNDAKKSGTVDQATYDAIHGKLQSIAGLAPKP